MSRNLSTQGSREPGTLSDADIVSKKSVGASLRSQGLRAAALTAATAALVGAMDAAPAAASGVKVTGSPIVTPLRAGVTTPQTKIPGGGFPIGVIYRPGMIKTR